MRTKYSLLSLIFTALSVPLGLVIGKSVELFLKSTNPSNIDVSGVLAYLGIILMTSIIVVGGCWAIALLCAIVAKRAGEKPSTVQAAFLVLILVIAFTVAGLLASKTTDSIVEKAKNTSVQAQE